MKILEIIATIEKFAAPELQEDYDNSGLITGSPGWECSGVICTLDVTEAVVNEAIQSNANLIVAHHPVIFRGLKKITGKNYVERVIIEAIKNDIAIYAAHTNLDNVLLGVNGMIAQKLGLKNISILQPKQKILRRLITFAPVDKAEQVRKAIFDAGGGKIGEYDECSFNTEGTGTFRAGENADPFVGEIGSQHHEKETKIEIVFPFFLERQIIEALVKAHPYEVPAYDIFTMENIHLGIGSGVVGELEEPADEQTFLSRIKKIFNTEGLRHTELRGKMVSKVAVCGGSGSFLLNAAIHSGAQAYITADMKYHEFFDADGKILVADTGHFESEQFTIDLLYDLLVKKFPTFAVLKTSVNTNPVRYYKD